jgi:hypothetical protein
MTIYQSAKPINPWVRLTFVKRLAIGPGTAIKGAGGFSARSAIVSLTSGGGPFWRSGCAKRAISGKNDFKEIAQIPGLLSLALKRRGRFGNMQLLAHRGDWDALAARTSEEDASE